MDNVNRIVSSLEINEKLYIDSQFQIQQFKKNELSSKNCVHVLRDLVRQSDQHCVLQNISDSGRNKFKSQLFIEYFNAVDNDSQDGFLNVNEDPIVKQDASDNLDVNYSRAQFAKFLNNFTTSLSQLKISNNSSVENISGNFLPKDENRFQNTEKFVPKKNSSHNYINNNHPIDKVKQTAFICKPLPKKRMCDKEDNEKEIFKKNKKMYNKSKESVKPQTVEKTDFVSARSLYKNPLKRNDCSSNDKSASKNDVESSDSDLRAHESLKNFDKKIVDIVLNEIMDFSPDINWSDIAGLQFVKSTVQEIVIWPLLRPDIFTGLRAPPRGILLFGPPGTGKTLIGKCIATESKSTFFCISASSLASKWVGESEQMVRALFAAARLNQPSVIFIDEIDALLSQRTDKEQDFSRKLKTEFLVQFDGAKTNSEERVLVVGATNRPHELDEAARRRFVKRLYVPLPDKDARRQIIVKLLKSHQHDVLNEDMEKICDLTDGYSGSDVANLCKEAAMGPIRCIGPNDIKTISLDQVRPISLNDFTDAMRQVRASVVEDDLKYFLDWNQKFGSFGIPG